jgi:hypothetical protein
MSKTLVQCLALGFLLLLLFMYPTLRLQIDRFRVPETTLEGSDRGSYRDYWGNPEMYDRATGYKCACYKKNRFYRENQCWEFYDRGGKGLGFSPKKPCY